MISEKSMFLFVVAVFIVTVPLLAGPPPPKYDPATEVTLQGDAVYVAEHPSKASWTGVYAIMKDGGGEIEVHLAPSSFLADAGIAIATGDTLKVVGSRVQWSGCDIILARQVTAKGKTLDLRRKDGTKLW